MQSSHRDNALHPIAQIARTPSHPGPEPRNVTLVRLAKLFASVDGLMAVGRFDDLRGMLGRISLALTMARVAEPNAPAEITGRTAGLGATVDPVR